MLGFNNFARYFLQLFEDLWADIVAWFTGIWNTLFVDVWNNIGVYFQIVGENSKKFQFMDWVMYVLTTIIILALVFFILYKIFMLLRKYVKFVAKEVEKEELLEEIAELNNKTLELVDEKNKIMALKVSQLGLRPDSKIEEPEEQKRNIGEGRFSKLASVDLEYATINTEIEMTYDDKISLPEVIERFVNFACSKMKLFYSKNQICYFFASMATSKVIILEGISGTGKTSLPYAMSKFFKNNASIISVQPSWRDRAELLGYLNEFTKKFNETDFLRALYETLYRKDINYIVLDEMNLARIEYYFAEFLSIMEMPDYSEWKIDLVPDVWDNDPKLLINGKLIIPQNVWFIGTANKDDSTFTITDKVYDRAMPIEFEGKGSVFTCPDTEPMNMSYEYLNELFEAAKREYSISQENLEKFSKLDQYLVDNFKLAFGNRILKQLNDFIPVFVACGGNELDGFDHMLTRKVLRKFESLNVAFMKDELNGLVTQITKLFGKNSFPESIKYIKNLQRMV